MNQTTQGRMTRGLVFAQFLLGLAAYTVFALPYLRRVHGMERMRPDRRQLFVANHVSLLDTVLLGALFWRARCYPILVLGDKSVWDASWIKRLVSSRIGYFLDRGKLNPSRIRELQAFGRAGETFQLVVFPEGTRGNGVDVAPCQPGIYYIAQAARVPIVPVFIENMQCVSTKRGRFHPFGGLRKVEVHFGEPIAPEDYLHLGREEFTDCLRDRISSVRPGQPAAHLSPALLQG
jgi:1-acyl-sn-glycerol-3-phosphate acyltransferase